MFGKTEPRPKSGDKRPNLGPEPTQTTTSTTNQTQATTSPTTDGDGAKVLSYDPEKYIDPCGREWDVRACEFYPGMMEIFCKKARVKTPDYLAGMYTGRTKAQQALFYFIAGEWEKVNTKRGSTRR